MTHTILSKWLTSHVNQYVDIVLAGRIFGGRHGESPQLVRKCDVTDVGVILRFDTTEILTVVNPAGFILGEHGQLIIPRADEAVFGWHYYGRPQVPENWCEEQYRLVGDHVEFSRVGPLLPEEGFFEYFDNRFVELV